MKKTFYYVVWDRKTQKTVMGGKVVCDYSDPKGVTNKALKEAKRAAHIYIHDTGHEVGYCVGGGKTDIAERAKEIMAETDRILDGRIAKPVSDIVKQLTAEGIERYGLGLYDAFKSAAAIGAEKGTKLYKAWYVNDLREYIPSSVFPDYLDFEKYPLAY